MALVKEMSEEKKKEVTIESRISYGKSLDLVALAGMELTGFVVCTEMH